MFQLFFCEVFIVILRGFFLFFILFFLLSDFSYAKFSVVGLSNFSVPRVNVDGNDVPISSKLGFGGGFLFEIPIDHRQRVGLELDLLIMNRKFNTNLVGGLETDSMTFINVPILLRAWVGKVLNVGIGWYFARGIGGVTRSMVDTSVSTSFGGVGIHAYDYGALAALCINVPFRNLSWFIEGRYQYGFFDAATGAADQWKNRDSQLLLGLRLGRQR